MAFKTQNYTIIWCEQCHTKTIIEPSVAFEGLKCTCKPIEEKNDGETNDSGTDNKAKRGRKANQG